MVAQPSGIVTFLFTDIERSTALLRALGTERYADALADHRRLLRAAFERHDGYEVDHEGDSFFVTFSDAAEAIAAAIEAQSALDSHAWADGQTIRVRMGAHTGEALVAPPKYVGLDVHRAARIMSAAHGGQLLISERTRQLVYDRRGGQLGLRELGSFELKDLPEPERLFQVVIAGLPDAFPPPRVQRGAPMSAGLPDYSLPPADIPCPYKGLAAFQREDADLFYGRDDLVAELVSRLLEASFIAVVGPSGSGKSSLVRAGAIPALEARDASLIPIVLTPGPEPLTALAEAIAPVAGTTAARILAVVEAAPNALAAMLDTASARVVLVIDQFEEIFSLCHDEAERQLFLNAVLGARPPGVPVVLALRADFYGHCAFYPSLTSLMEQHQALIGPMSAEELRSAIERPAEKSGLVIEPGLVEGMLNDVVGEPGALPLLSHSLVETWKRRSGRTLTLLGYLQAGGVRGALAKTAELVFNELAPERQRLARSVFLRLVNVGENLEYTGRRATLDELVPRKEQTAAVGQLVQVLVDARLVTVGEGRSVAIAHEALIRHWPRLQEWLSEDRHGRLVHARLAEAAREWVATEGDPGGLYRGGRLATASDWAAIHDDQVNEVEREFLAASRDAERAEVEATRRRNRRLRALAAGLTLMLVGATVAAVVALQQRSRAQLETRRAVSEAVAREAEAVFPRQGDLGLLLALEAYRTARTETARTALLTMIRRTGSVQAIFRGHQSAVTSVALGADGHTIVSGGNDGHVLLWDVRRGRPFTVPFRPRGAKVTSVALSRNGKVVAWGTDGGEVGAWDRSSREPVATFVAHRAAVDSISLNPDGTVLTSGSAYAGTARLWDLRRRRALGPDVAVESSYRGLFGFSQGGSLAAVPDSRGGVRVLNLRTGRLLIRLAPRRRTEITAAAINREGTQVAAGGTSGHIVIWAIRAARPVVELAAPQGTISGLEFSANGNRLVSGSLDGSVAVWNLRRQRLAMPLLRSFAGAVQAVAMEPDGRAVAAGTADGAVVVWNQVGAKSVAAPLSSARGTTAFAIDAAGTRYASGDIDGRISIWSPSGERLGATIRAHTGPVSSLAFSPAGRVLASGGLDGRVRFFDLRTHRFLGSGFVPSPEGQLDPVDDLTYDPRGAILAAASQNGFIALWDAAARRVTVTRASGLPDIWHIAFARDGRRLAVSSARANRVLIWSVAARQREFEFDPHQQIGPIAFGTTSDILAIGGATGTVTLWRIGRASASPIGDKLVSGAGDIFSIAIDPTGTTLAVGSGDGIVSFYDLSGVATLVARIKTLGETVDRAAFTPDDRWLIAAGASGIVRLRSVLWTRDPRTLQSHVCALVERNLTLSEWRQFFPGRSYRLSCPGDPAAAG